MYKVIRILSKKKILIDYGQKEGSEKGKQVRVVNIGPVITHPDTSEALGTFDEIKAELEIVEVYPAFSVCANIKREQNPLFNPLQNLVRTTVTYENINVDPAQIQPIMYENSKSGKMAEYDPKVVKIGDTVVLCD